MKTSTIMWTLAVLIILIGAGAYFFTETPAAAPTTTVNIATSNEQPLPQGDMAPVPTKPIASTTTNVGASSTVHIQ